MLTLSQQVQQASTWIHGNLLFQKYKWNCNGSTSLLTLLSFDFCIQYFKVKFEADERYLRWNTELHICSGRAAPLRSLASRTLNCLLLKIKCKVRLFPGGYMPFGWKKYKIPQSNKTRTVHFTLYRSLVIKSNEFRHPRQKLAPSTLCLLPMIPYRSRGGNKIWKQLSYIFEHYNKVAQVKTRWILSTIYLIVSND